MLFHRGLLLLGSAVLYISFFPPRFLEWGFHSECAILPFRNVFNTDNILIMSMFSSSSKLKFLEKYTLLQGTTVCDSSLTD